jgi:asparagine synthetase A
MIVRDTLPAYQDYLANHPAEARALIASDVGQRIDAQRLQHQIDDIAGRLGSDWHVDVDTGWGG